MFEQVLTALPWAAVMVIYVGEKFQQWRVIRALDEALRRAQVPSPGPSAPAAPQVAPASQNAPPAAAAPPPSLPVPKPNGAFDSAPPWFQWALHEIGAHEDTGNRGAAVRRYVSLAHCGAEGDPWCAIFANAALESSGARGTRSPSSQSFRSDPNFVQLQGPALGAIAVFWRDSQSSGLGHVGFYRGEDATRVWTLGGNENDMVQIEALPKTSSSFGLIGYWWPKGTPLPQAGAVIMPSGSPVNVQSPPAGLSPAAPASPNGRQTGIVATVFGGSHSAYGGPINDKAPGVALPFRFAGTRPRVRVINPKTGASVDCDIVDVGPWNTNDQYWATGARPEAESGTDLGQTGSRRHTNSAGIDLTAAAASAIGIDGKGLCSWEFLPGPDSPKVT